jgi:hypothetical protein
LGVNLEAVGGPEMDTPLATAAYHGYMDVVEYLVEQGVDLNIRDRDNKTALFLGHLVILSTCYQSFDGEWSHCVVNDSRFNTIYIYRS